MKKVGKPWFFIVTLLIFALSYTTFYGVYGSYGDITKTYIRGAKDIRFGIDIRGGVSVTFGPAGEADATKEQIEAAAAVLKNRLVGNNITDYEIYTDAESNRIIVSYPWKDEQRHDVKNTIDELSATAQLLFIEGVPNDIAFVDSENAVVYDSSGQTYKIAIEGKHIETASVAFQSSDGKTSQRVVQFNMNAEGKARFGVSTAANINGYISIWLDGVMLSAPMVNSAITDGTAVITSGETAEGFSAVGASSLANNINAGALPFALETTDYSVVEPTLGENSLQVMLLGGIIAFIAICIFMVIYYKLPGVVACVALLGQAAGMLATISGYFGIFNSFTLTLPGIAGIILSVGMGVDANIVTAERIKEEVRKGKTLDGAIDAGDENSFAAIFDSNIANIIVAVILMGVFGPPNTLWSWLTIPVPLIFPAATTGAIYSFGYALLMGVLFNFIMGVFASRIMLKSLSRFSIFRKRWLYGGVDE